uniref:Calmodulin-binding protein n=1 Tax=Kalanchoe fedtschenkoi TaxID=63787 RepID=A0A7N0U894_KALFE
MMIVFNLTCSTMKLFEGITTEEIQSIFEPFLRKTVREAVDKSFHVLSPARRGVSTTSHEEPRRGWMLRFVNQPPPKFFTANKVEDKDGAPLQLEVVDVDSKTRVLDAPLSLLKLGIVVLDGDFNANQQEDWGEKYFNSHIVCAREGKKPLMTGEIRISLKNGMGFIRDVFFTDNSRWTRSGKFRLGIRVLQSSCKGFGVREAVSDAFKVKDRRGEACMKHLHPSLNDEVWRLNKIRRNGIFHKRLESIGITTVKEFLQMLERDPSLLKKKLKCGNSNRIWDTIVKHATTCLLSHDEGRCKDHKITPKGVCSSSYNHGVGVCNSKLNSRTSPHMCSFQQVPDDLEGYVFDNGINQVQVDGAPVDGSVNVMSEPLIPPRPSLQFLDIPITYSGQQGHELARFVPSPSEGYELVSHMADPLLNPTLFNLPQVDSFFAPPSTGTSNVGSSCWPMNDDPFDALIQATEHHAPDDFFQTETPTWASPLLWRQFSASFSAPISESKTTLFSYLAPASGSTKMAWSKLRAVVHILLKQRRVRRTKKALAKSVLCTTT